MRCTFCDQEALTKNMRFCPQCGKQIIESELSKSQAQPRESLEISPSTTKTPAFFQLNKKQMSVLWIGATLFFVFLAADVVQIINYQNNPWKQTYFDNRGGHFKNIREMMSGYPHVIEQIDSKVAEPRRNILVLSILAFLTGSLTVLGVYMLSDKKGNKK